MLFRSEPFFFGTEMTTQSDVFFTSFTTFFSKYVKTTKIEMTIQSEKKIIRTKMTSRFL